MLRMAFVMTLQMMHIKLFFRQKHLADGMRCATFMCFIVTSRTLFLNVKHVSILPARTQPKSPINEKLIRFLVLCSAGSLQQI